MNYMVTLHFVMQTAESHDQGETSSPNILRIAIAIVENNQPMSKSANFDIVMIKLSFTKDQAARGISRLRYEEQQQEEHISARDRTTLPSCQRICLTTYYVSMKRSIGQMHAWTKSRSLYNILLELLVNNRTIMTGHLSNLGVNTA